MQRPVSRPFCCRTSQGAGSWILAPALVPKAQPDLSDTEIRSPIAGLIGRLAVHVGNLVGKTNAALLATVSSAGPLYVNFAIRDYLNSTIRTFVFSSERRPGSTLSAIREDRG